MHAPWGQAPIAHLAHVPVAELHAGPEHVSPLPLVARGCSCLRGHGHCADLPLAVLASVNGASLAQSIDTLALGPFASAGATTHRIGRSPFHLDSNAAFRRIHKSGQATPSGCHPEP